MEAKKIDLICLSDIDVTVNWTLGGVIYSRADLSSLYDACSTRLKQSDADWFVFWNFELGLPEEDLIIELSKTKVDVYHAGLKLGNKGLPEILNYVHPTWMYNIDASDDTTHTNFRLTFEASMIHRKVFEKLGLFSIAYDSLQMAGIAYGYQILKQGAVVRYEHRLVNSEKKKEAVTLNDEWIFARHYFEKRWQLWTLLNKNGRYSNFRAWSKTKYIKPINTTRTLHPSHISSTKVERKEVSVLAPTLDRYSYIKEELRELNEQTILPLEVLITDQTDKDRRQPIDFTHYKNLTIKYFPQEQKGQCLAWNKLIDESLGEYVFFFGDDAYDIKPKLIEKMLQTMQHFNADMVASNVYEKGIKYDKTNYHYYASDTFPITLIKKSVVEKTGKMDMFFNRYAKADHDLAMRCHLNGTLMIFDPSAEIGHHRAPSGGLRTHKARVVTNYMAKNSLTKFLHPTPSEIFLYKKYYSEAQYRSHIKIKYVNQLLVKGGLFRKVLRLLVFLVKSPSLYWHYRRNLAIANTELNNRDVI